MKALMLTALMTLSMNAFAGNIQADSAKKAALAVAAIGAGEGRELVVIKSVSVAQRGSERFYQVSVLARGGGVKNYVVGVDRAGDVTQLKRALR